jgi:hydroxymethylglutaryl-CoA reductase
MKTSRINGLYRMSIEARIDMLASRGFIGSEDAERLKLGNALLPLETADRMIENVIGVFGLPLAVAPNFTVNGKDYVVPMVVEEPSIVAAVSGAAKLIRNSGGFTATATESLLIGQVQVVGIDDPDKAVQSLYARRGELIDRANALHPSLVRRGGGAREIEFYKYRLPDEDWAVVLHLLVDTRDAMGANIVNTMCEGIAPQVEEICGGDVVLRILSNLADRALVTAKASISLDSLTAEGHSAEFVRDSIVLANDFANADPYRAATHNKGIMNGVDAVAVATGNDWRAIEAGAHAFAVRRDRYRSLTRWSVAANGDLVGELELPLKPGVVGGSLTANPGARTGLAISGVKTAIELAELMAAVGLAQNFAALRALVSAGIQKGHMSLHARSVAAAAQVPEARFEEVVAGLIQSGDIKVSKAVELAEASSESRLPPLDDAAVGESCGKVILLGEHAVVYDRHALALPLPAAVRVAVARRPSGVSLSAPDWNLREEWKSMSVSRGAASVIDLIMRELKVDTGLDFRVEARIPIGMGLGSSAAFAVAAIRAVCALLGFEKSDLEIDRLAFRCEELTHGTPSGIDNNLATFGEPVLYSRGSRTRTRPITLRELPPLVIAISGERGDTKSMVAGVRERFDRNQALYESLFDEIDEISVAGAAALREGDYELLGALMNVCHGLLNAIEVSTPDLERMIRIARGAGALGAKLTGAGGGGSIIALCPGKVTEVSSALCAAGFDIVYLDKEGQ